ncbi:MAG: hemolysin family protein [Planctomycetaceae bacterium]
MSLLPPAATVVGLAGCFFFSLAAHSLRDFSRHRLAECCASRNRSARFGEILKRHESAFVACDAFAVLGLLVFLAGSMIWFQLPPLQPVERNPGRLASLALGLLVLVLLCRLILPWTVARVAGEPFLCRAWPILRLFALVMSPLVFVARRLDRLSHRVAGLPEPASGDAAALTEEIRSVVDEGRREGLIEAEAGTMIQRVIELQDEDIGAVMTPRTEMVTIRTGATVEDARRTFIEAGHSRVPVIGDGVDDVLGILYAKDLLSHLDGAGSRDEPVEGLIREPFYVPITTRVDTVLETMKRQRIHLAIVVDEYGGVAGLVTLEDVLEEIVGDIVDEYDPAEENGIIRRSATALDVEGWVHLDDLNEEFGLGLPEDEGFDTLGGFVVDEMARVPEAGEQFTWQNLRMTILDADRRKVNRVQIEVVGPTPSAAGNG